MVSPVIAEFLGLDPNQAQSSAQQSTPPQAGPAGGGNGSAFPVSTPGQAPPAVAPTDGGGGTPDPGRGDATLPPADLPVFSNPDEVIDTFYRQHGRRPSGTELQAIHALPILSRQYGRRPSRQELFAFLRGRDETPPNQQNIFSSAASQSGQQPAQQPGQQPGQPTGQEGQQGAGAVAGQPVVGIPPSSGQLV